MGISRWFCHSVPDPAVLRQTQWQAQVTLRLACGHLGATTRPMATVTPEHVICPRRETVRGEQSRQLVGTVCRFAGDRVRTDMLGGDIRARKNAVLRTIMGKTTLANLTIMFSPVGTRATVCVAKELTQISETPCTRICSQWSR